MIEARCGRSIAVTQPASSGTFATSTLPYGDCVLRIIDLPGQREAHNPREWSEIGAWHDEGEIRVALPLLESFSLAVRVNGDAPRWIALVPVDPALPTRYASYRTTRPHAIPGLEPGRYRLIVDRQFVKEVDVPKPIDLAIQTRALYVEVEPEEARTLWPELELKRIGVPGDFAYLNRAVHHLRSVPVDVRDRRRRRGNPHSLSRRADVGVLKQQVRVASSCSGDPAIW